MELLAHVGKKALPRARALGHSSVIEGSCVAWITPAIQSLGHTVSVGLGDMIRRCPQAPGLSSTSCPLFSHFPGFGLFAYLYILLVHFIEPQLFFL